MSRKQHFSAQSASDEATVVISCGPLGPGFQFWPVCLPLQVQGLGHGGGGGTGAAQVGSAVQAASVVNLPLPSCTALHLPSGGESQFHVGGGGGVGAAQLGSASQVCWSLNLPLPSCTALHKPKGNGGESQFHDSIWCLQWSLSTWDGIYHARGEEERG